VRELFDYDPATGILTWKVLTAKKIRVGNRAGCATWTGREKKRHSRFVGFRGKKYAEHTLIWIWMTGTVPSEEIDHKNRISDDNRWHNLRSATRSQNQANTGPYRNCRSGVRGVHFIPSGTDGRRTGTWRAMITKDGKARHLGYFTERWQAQEAWQRAAAEAHGIFAAA
jgi:hypothetical protein